MEYKEAAFVHTTKSVAKEMLGPEFKWDKNRYDYPRIRDKVELFQEAIKDIPFRGTDANDSRLYAIIKKITGTFNGVAQEHQEVSWASAVLVVYYPDVMKTFTPGQRRFFLDLGIGVTVDYLSNLHEFVQRNADYEFKPDRKQELQEYADRWKRGADTFRKYHEKLREKAASSGQRERAA